MNTLQVHTAKHYEIHIGSGLLLQIGQLASKVVPGRNAVVISDTNVWPIYGNCVISSLAAADFSADAFIIPAGEEHKNLGTYSKILDFLAEKQLCRKDVIIALGGGVVGDLAGFTAATYLRGISFIQVPTSLLAMVDSSVGGKTAVNLPTGKNLVGAFYQPSLVVCDTDTLSTLPREIFLDGCAEVIKYGILYDPLLFRHLEESGAEFDLKNVITRCAELKSIVVIEDELEQAQRTFLNLGHTFAHAIEACSNYGISHGRAVAIGLAMAARISNYLGFCDKDVPAQITNLLTRLKLPVCTNFSAQELFTAAIADKKRHANQLALVLPEAIGRCKITTVELNELLSLIEAGL